MDASAAETESPPPEPEDFDDELLEGLDADELEGAGLDGLAAGLLSALGADALELDGFLALDPVALGAAAAGASGDRKSTRLNSSHVAISYAGFCLKKNTY